jgi:hypothetical protein
MAATNPAKQRAMRQEQLRTYLSEKCRLEHVIDNIIKMEKQGASMEANELNSPIKYATDASIRLINKYLPELKATEMTGEGGDDLVVSLIKRRFDGIE